MNNLPEIRDIHIPDDVSIFPLAYGWWIILAILLLSLCCFWIIRKAIKTSRKHYALKTLANISSDTPISAAIKISELLKRICASKYKNALALYGEEWLMFLNQHSDTKLDGKAANLLIYAPFIDVSNSSYSSQDIDKLRLFAKKWIGENL
ncbi:MAG: DUF4381 domain-containing protein [Acetobacter sp.]|nr:DUF4381 domain-containing protein [Acetobacter sp.]